jgi:hypothetical protein
MGWRTWSRRAVDSHRPGARSRCRGDRGILSGLQPARVSSAVRRFQGRLAGDSGLNWKRRRAAAALVRLWPVALLRCCAQRRGQNRCSSSNGTETPIQRFSVRQDDLSVASRLPVLTSGRVLDDRRLRGSVAERCAERGSVVGGVADALGGRKLGLTEMILLIVVVGDVRMDP